MTILLITGSRDATPAMLGFALRCVIQAKAKDYEIIVGDAEGVDAAVIAHAHTFGVKCTVYGGYGRIRRRSPSCATVILTGDYPARDRVLAASCNICMAIWNGTSAGTRITFQEAKRLGKVVHVRDFSKEMA